MSVPSALARAATAFAAGHLDSAAFAAAFAMGEVYAVRPPKPAPPGLVAVGEPGRGHVLVFTSLDELGRQAGECDWLRTTGDDLLSLVPDGYGVMVDAAGEHPLVLPPSALRRGPMSNGGPR
ncbi:MAG: SseB family protein [Sporichthyaceae bacterium]